MNLKFTNNEIKPLGELLKTLTLKGKESRRVMDLFKILAKHYNENVNEQLEKLSHDYGNKDENGELIYLDKEKNIIEVSMDYFDEERILLNEEFFIECNDNNKLMLLTSAQVLLEGEFEVDSQIAMLYNMWCEKFEEVIEFYNTERE